MTQSGHRLSSDNFNSLGFRWNANQSGFVWIKVDLWALFLTSIRTHLRISGHRQVLTVKIVVIGRTTGLIGLKSVAILRRSVAWPWPTRRQY
jgi:hypothetical protein